MSSFYFRFSFEKNIGFSGSFNKNGSEIFSLKQLYSKKSKKNQLKVYNKDVFLH